MEAEQVTEKILADARGQADKIKKAADEREAGEQAQLQEQVDEYKKQTEVLAKKEGKDKKAHLLAAARMEIAKEYLAEKRAILDEVFEQARGRLRNLPDDDYRSFWGKLMLAAVETGDEEVIVDKNEKRIDRKFIEDINNQLGAGGKGNLRLSDEKLNLAGGFILRRGKIKKNISLDVLLAGARRELETELAKELFVS